jgi:predicted SnoaL-like aldol condensation-catalyzing enzyme
MSPSSPESPLEQNKRLALRWLDEVWNRGRRDTIRELFAKTAVYHRAGKEYHGPAGFAHFYDIMTAQFSQLSIKPIITVAEADLVCVHWSVNALFTATRTPVNFTGTTIWRVKDEQFVEAWQNWDAAGLTAQVPGLSLP